VVERLLARQSRGLGHSFDFTNSLFYRSQQRVVVRQLRAALQIAKAVRQSARATSSQASLSGWLPRRCPEKAR
jgi:hypothetical protein